MAVLAATLVWSAAERQVYGQAAPQKKVKDQGEYDLYNNAVKETDPAKKLQYVNQWAEKYPETDFKEERLQLYDQLNQPAKVVAGRDRPVMEKTSCAWPVFGSTVWSQPVITPPVSLCEAS